MKLDQQGPGCKQFCAKTHSFIVCYSFLICRNKKRELAVFLFESVNCALLHTVHSICQESGNPIPTKIRQQTILHPKGDFYLLFLGKEDICCPCSSVSLSRCNRPTETSAIDIIGAHWSMLIRIQHELLPKPALITLPWLFPVPSSPALISPFTDSIPYGGHNLFW